ncbi:MAG: methyltransferase domain-containing protein [bacterium]
MKILCCPETKSELELKIISEENGEVKEGILTNQNGKIFPIKNFVPRFVESDSYVDNFSLEWLKHRITQYDTNPQNKNKKFTESDFRNMTGLTEEKIQGKTILDVGVGTGRYSAIASEWGGQVIGIDLSFAVESAATNIGNRKNVNIIQADIFKLPFKENVFDIIFSIGVLHHTPDTESAFKQLPQHLKKGGLLSIWVYNAYNKQGTKSKHFWHNILKKLPKKFLYNLSYLSVPLSYLYRIPYLGGMLYYFFPIVFYTDRNWRWTQLDTFDLYSPEYMYFHKYPEVFQWFRNSNFVNIEISEPPISVRGIKI